MKKLMLTLAVLVCAASSFAYYNSEQGRWMNRDPIEETGGDNLYGFLDNDPIIYIDTLGLYRVEYKKQVWSIQRMGNAGGFTASSWKKEKPWVLDCPNGDTGMCTVKNNAEYVQYITRVLPQVGSSRRAAWVTKSFYNQSKRHENKHVKVNKHYGKVFKQLEKWQKSQEACGKTTLEQKLSSCELKAALIFAQREATHAQHASETWSIVTGWISSRWTAREPNSRFKQEEARVFRMFGSWDVNLPEIELNCDEE